MESTFFLASLFTVVLVLARALQRDVRTALVPVPVKTRRRGRR